MLSKPLACADCSLFDRGKGYVPATGPTNAPILLVGEAAGPTEILHGEPFVGPAGAMLNRLLLRNHQQRDAFRIDNVCRCFPPNAWFDPRAPYYFSARQHCTERYLSETLREPHKVIVALGGVATRYLLGMDQDCRIEDFHGTVNQTPHGLVIPTFHPSHLQRGAMNLFGTVSYDLQQALRVAADGYQQDAVSVVVDPPVDWFTQWVEQVEAAVAHDPQSVGLAEDIETPDKSSGQDEGQLTSEDRSYTIVRINFSVHPDEGITVPYQGPYVALCERLFRLPCLHYLWNKEYDDPRIRAAGHTFGGERVDGMWAAHFLQSDVPRGLGFWAPFYCHWGAWKYLARTQPGFYGACDGFKTYRTVTGIISDLVALGMWEGFWRHTHQVHQYALQPAQLVGVQVDRPRLEAFVQDLEIKQRRLLHEMQGLVPDALRPLTPKGGLKRPPAEGRIHSKGTELTVRGVPKKEAPDPVKQDLYAQVAVVVARRVSTLVYCCDTCGGEDTGGKHRCPVDGSKGEVVLREVAVDRYFWQEPFNPDSPPQILAYIKARGHKPGKAKKTHADSTDKDTLARLIKTTKDPLYKAILDARAVSKIKGTYGVGILKRLDQDNRVHPVPTFAPSTHRLSYRDPNITNIVVGKEGKDTLAAGFRKCVTPLKGCRLLEVDFAAIEAKLTGWFARDPEFIRLAALGVHGALVTHILGEPYNPTWSDADLAQLFREAKRAHPLVYDRAKRAVYGDLYGQTDHGMVLTFPETFPTLKVARQYKQILHTMAPTVPAWQTHVRERAYAQNYLGGPGDHPFGYKHWYWDVLGFRLIPSHIYRKRQQAHEPVTTIQGKYFAVVLGNDAKRCVAYYPQSTAAGVLKEALLRLFHPDSPSYIGNCYFGRTPLRAPIHDSIFAEVPIRQWDRVVERIDTEMTRAVPELSLGWIPAAVRASYGFGEALSIGVEIKGGADWGSMETIERSAIGVSGDGLRFPLDEDLENTEEFEALGTEVA